MEAWYQILGYYAGRRICLPSEGVMPQWKQLFSLQCTKKFEWNSLKAGREATSFLRFAGKFFLININHKDKKRFR